MSRDKKSRKKSSKEKTNPGLKDSLLDSSTMLTRRKFLVSSALAAAAPAAALLPVKQSSASTATTLNRIERAYQIRLRAAKLQRALPLAKLPTNRDEQAIPNKITCFTKGFPHDKIGHVDLPAYEAYLRALKSGDPKLFERIPLGGYSKLANPQGAWGFDLVGADSSQMEMSAPPNFGSAEQASEMVELYWHALAREVPFVEYDSSTLISKASEDLLKLKDFRGSQINGRVASTTVFRGNTGGDLVGPYVSQFLARDIPLSPIRAPQKIRTAVPSVDYLTNFQDWLSMQNGALAGVNQFDSQPRYIRNGRDLGEYVHRDFTYQAFICAASMLFNMGAAPDGSNPYKYSRTQSGFVTFGPPFIWYLIAVVTQLALKATWFQKWLVHRRLRPEEFGGRAHNHHIHAAEYPIHESLWKSMVLDEVFSKNGNYLLPMAYPEGCPLHPSYPAGHAAIAGACVTVLKACFDESFVIPNPVVSKADGLSLDVYQGPPLTVGGELNKLASNIAIGRDFAGVHWRSDSIEGMNLGEEVAINFLREARLTGNELFTGFSLTTFAGKQITVR